MDTRDYSNDSLLFKEVVLKKKKVELKVRKLQYGRPTLVCVPEEEKSDEEKIEKEVKNGNKLFD